MSGQPRRPMNRGHVDGRPRNNGDVGRPPGLHRTGPRAPMQYRPSATTPRGGQGHHPRGREGTSHGSAQPISAALLERIIQERDPDQLIIALESKAGWNCLLGSEFSVRDLDTILSACVKCAGATSSAMLSRFVEHVLANSAADNGNSGQRRGGHFVTRAASLIVGMNGAEATSVARRSLTSRSRDMSLSNVRSTDQAGILSESRMIDNALKLIEVAVSVSPAALASPCKVLLSVIEHHKCFELWKRQIDDDVQTVIDAIKEQLEATVASSNLGNANEQGGSSNKYDRGPVFLRGYRIKGGAPDNFRQISILPTKEDLQEHTPYLRQNITKGKYASVDDYLDTQFRLLREDYIAPLRAGLQQIRDLGPNISRRDLNKLQDVRLYTEAVLDENLTAKQVSAECRVVLRLPLDSVKKINWERSKRFSNGSLIGVSFDNFVNIVFTTVVARNVENLQKGIVELELCQREDMSFFKTQELYSLIESSGAYFEAYRHNLAVLQAMNAEQFPFAQQLVFVDNDIGPPRYLSDAGPLQLSPIIKKTYRYKIPNGWPQVAQSILNDAQLKAVRSAFERKLCIIQGPPGTGKTFAGLKIVELLLLNKPTDEPILAVCYTNHALDQFLEGILEFEKKIVRIGGRCQNEKLAGVNLQNLRLTYRTTLGQYDRNEADTRRLLNNNRSSQKRIVASIQRAELLHRQLHGRAVFHDRECIYKSSKLTWNEFLDLNNLVARFRAKVAEATENGFTGDPQGPTEVEDGYLSDEDRGQLEEEGEAALDSTGNLVVSQHEEAVLSFLGSWEDRFADMQYLDIAEYKFAILEDLLANGDDIWLEFSTLECWLLYRQRHWKTAEREVDQYIRTSQIEVSPDDAFWVATEKIQEYMKSQPSPIVPTLHAKRQLVVRCLEDRLRELRMLLARQRREEADLRLAFDIEVARGHRLIGMTTTGAAKHNRLIQRVGCKIVIIEEAAEILEQHVITTLGPAVEHLILIGDHQQLQPSTTVFTLARDFQMQVSLFERLLKNRMPYVRLQEQHRMRDTFLQLLVPTIYSDYFSHESVFNYEHIRGLSQDLCFITHVEGENSEGEARSKSNLYEACFVTHLAQYLLMQGYDANQITILTTYSGQVFTIRNEIRNRVTVAEPTEAQQLVSAKLKGVRVTTVDNFQGEENDVIIISFVRSNDQAQIGFLSRDNRVCVALSRAKKGLFCIGNMAMLAKASATWRTISAKLFDKGCIKSGIELFCQRHDRKLLASKPQDFDVFSQGGCDHPCEERLKCGHVCPRTCHKVDADHTLFKCRKSCERPRSECSHRCVNLCCEPCGDCNEKVTKHLPCGHEATERCCVPPATIECVVRVKKDLKCGHSTMTECWIRVENIICKMPCTRALECGTHPCKKKCGAPCSKCMEFVTARSPCGHDVKIVCRDRNDVVSLRRACEELVRVKLACGHEQNVECSNRFTAVAQLSIKCTVPTKVTLPCGHQVEVPCKQAMNISKQSWPCKENVTLIAECGHTIKKTCGEPAKRCTELIVVKAQCKHDVRVSCCYKTDPVAIQQACHTRCTQALLCGHQCSGSCQACRQGAFHTSCGKQCRKTLFCGHTCSARCHEQCAPCRSKETHECAHSRFTRPCIPISVQPCTKKAQHACAHADHLCDAATCSDCICRCDEPCKKKICCADRVDRASARRGGRAGSNSRRPKNHDCIGICGEICPSLCRHCDADKLKFFPMAKGVKRDDARYLQLPCQHVFEVRWLDQHVDEQLAAVRRPGSGYAAAVAFPSCPRCFAQLRYVRRYNALLAPMRHRMATLSDRVFGNMATNKESQMELFGTAKATLPPDSMVKKAILNRITALDRPTANDINYLRTVLALFKVLQTAVDSLPHEIEERLLESKQFERQLLADAVRWLEANDVEARATLHVVPEPTDKWVVCTEGHMFSTKTLDNCPLCPPPQEEAPQ